MESDRAKKVGEVESFIHNVLKEDLKKMYEIREKTHEKIRDYVLLKDTIQNTLDGKFPKDGLKTKIDLGCNFYVQGKVTEPATVFVHVGYGFFLEFKLVEALSYIEKRIGYLSCIASKETKKCASIKAYIQVLQESLPLVQSLEPKS